MTTDTTTAVRSLYTAIRSLQAFDVSPITAFGLPRLEWSAGSRGDRYPVHHLIRPYKLIDLAAAEVSTSERVGLDDLLDAAMRTGLVVDEEDILILRFGLNGAALAHRELDEEACSFLASRSLTAVAADSPPGRRWRLPGHLPVIHGLANLGTVPCQGLFVALPPRVPGIPMRVMLLG